MVQITDFGCGIAVETQDRILEPFFTTKGMGKSSGLGLDIAKEIIDKHQGIIEIERKLA